jgi:signal transduction histidine kinase
MSIFGKKQLYFPSLLIIAVVILLLVWISFSTYHNFNRGREQTLEFMYQHGLTIIHVVEAGAKTGLMMPQWNRKILAALIEETGKNKNIAYIYLYDKNMRILYHSLHSPEQKEPAWTPLLSKEEPVKYQVRTLSKTSRIYELAKYFTLLSDNETALGAEDLLKIYPGWSRYYPQPMAIVLGMNLKEFQEARKADFHHAIIMGVIVIALGSGALFFLFVIQNYYVVDRTLEKTRDYTREVEERVRQSEKLAAVGQLAAGVAHEVRNPLSSIRGFAQFLRHSLKDRPEDREYAEIIVREVDRINRVVTDLLTFARPVIVDRSPVDLPEIIQHTIRLVTVDAQSLGVSIHTHLSENLTSGIWLDKNEVTQAILNLLLNSLSAVSEGGAIDIGAGIERGGGRVQIWVEDDGTGILPDHLNKVFDPFFTTRDNGTGLGLAIVNKIVENHQGEIVIQSPPDGKNRGTRISLYFPMNFERKIEEV